MSRLGWLADVLTAEGLHVVPVAGWERRGDNGIEPAVIVDHHTGGAIGAPAPSLPIVVAGRRSGDGFLPGPLANLLIGRDSTVYVVAAGISNNAGIGAAPRFEAYGNRHTIGIEAEHCGSLTVEPATPEFLGTVARVDAAICRHLGWTADRAVAHKEWARPKGRKVDPCWSASEHRHRVAEFLLEGEQMSSLNVRRAAAESIIYRQYRAIAGREPDPAGLAFWLKEMDAAAERDLTNQDDFDREARAVEQGLINRLNDQK